MTWTTRQSRMLGTSDGSPATAAIVGNPKRIRSVQPQGACVSSAGLRPAFAFNAATPTPKATLVGSIYSGAYGLAAASYGASWAASSTSNVRLSSGTADFIVITVTNSLHGGYVPGALELVITNGDGYAGGIFISSYYGTVEFSVKETYSGALASNGSVTKSKPSVVIGRRSGLNVDLFIKVQGQAATKTSATDTVVRNIQANGSMHYNIGGNSGVAMAQMLEGSFSDAQIYSLLDNPYQIFQSLSSPIWGPA